MKSSMTVADHVLNILSRTGRRLADTAKRPKQLLESIKKEYGLVPAQGESFSAFEQRVHETLTRKDNLETDFTLNALTSRGYKDTTAHVQRIIREYIGINTIPIDAFETAKMEFVAGATYGQRDGSSVVITNDLADNRSDLLRLARYGLECLIHQRPIRSTSEASSFDRVFTEAGFREDVPIHELYRDLYAGLLKNEEFIRLHEGIHAVHFNNHHYGRRGGDALELKTKEQLLGMTVANMIPIWGPFGKARYFLCQLESETLAYKVGLDAYIDRLLDDAAAGVHLRDRGLTPAHITAVKEEFRTLNTAFTKAIIKKGYLETAVKGYGNATTNYTKAMMEVITGSYFMIHDHIAYKVIGGLAYLFAANNLLKAGLSVYFNNRIDQCVDTLDNLSHKFGSSATAFYETLGKSFKERQRLAQAG